MRLSVDTNVLVRAVVRDEERQAKAADAQLKAASVIAIALPCLCEFVWVLRGVYGFSRAEMGAAIRDLYETESVQMNRAAVDAGLVMLDQGGDFADGVIAFEAHSLGGEVFVSFDKKAVTLLSAQGFRAKLLS